MNESNKPHILVLRLSALGDVAMTLPVLLAVCRTYPGVRLTIATKAAFAPLFKTVPQWNLIEVRTGNRHKGLFGLWKLHRELLAGGPDAVADLHNVLRTRILRVFFGTRGIPVETIDKARNEKRRLTAPRNKVWKPLKSTHQRYADVFSDLGFPVNLLPSDVLPRLPWPEVPGLPKPPKENHRIGLAPFAAHPGKCYPENAMEEVLSLLGRDGRTTIYLFGGGPREANRLSRWEAKFDHCVSAAGRGGLGAELALISNLDLMVSMDSGNGHLAAMFGLPVVTLWGVTHPYAGFAPFGQPADRSLTSDRTRYPAIPTSVYGNKVPEGYERVMESIPPERVYEKIREVIGSGSGTQASTTGDNDRK